MKLTVKSTAALKLPTGKSDAITFDSSLPGFGLRLRERGSRVWIFQYSLGSKQRRITIGSATAITPEKAREIAANLHAKVRLGGDPAADKAAARAEAALSFKAVADRFLARQQVRLRPRSYVQAERHIRISKPLYGMPIATIDRRAIAALLTAITDFERLGNQQSHALHSVGFIRVGDERGSDRK